jgi:hypothetical protein
MLAAEAIPYTNFKQKIRIVKEELKKNRYIEIKEAKSNDS